MCKADFAAINNQPDLLSIFRLTFQPLSRNGFIPFADGDRRVSKQSAQAARDTDQFRFSWDFPGDTAQIDRAALINPNDQPDEASNLGNALVGTQFPNSLNPSMIQGVDRHETSG
jgi:hypothetical protein